MNENIVKENVKHLKFYEVVTRFLGIGLFILSTVYTVQLMQSFGQAGIQKLLFTVFGVCMQGSQLVCLAVGFLLVYTGNRVKANYFFTAFAVLMILSFVGTIGFFSVNQKKNQISAFSTDKKYAELKAQIENYDKQIAETNKQIAEFTSRSIMTRGVSPARERLNKLSAKRDALAEELLNYKPQAVSDSLYVSLAEFFDAEPDSIKFGMNVVYAVLLDILSGLFMWFSLFLRYEIIPKHADSIQPENYDKEDSVKPYESSNKPFYLPNPANAAMTFQDTDKENYIQYLLKENQLLKQKQSSQENTQRFTQKPILNQSQDTDISELSKSPHADAHADADAHAHADAGVLKKYIECLFSAKKSNGSLLGRHQIADLIGIDNRVAEKIHRKLKMQGFLRIDGTRSFAVVTKEAMLNAIIGNSKSITQSRIGF